MCKLNLRLGREGRKNPSKEIPSKQSLFNSLVLLMWHTFPHFKICQNMLFSIARIQPRWMSVKAHFPLRLPSCSPLQDAFTEDESVFFYIISDRIQFLPRHIFLRCLICSYRSHYSLLCTHVKRLQSNPARGVEMAMLTEQNEVLEN